ncbi:MAG TPA: homoserine O-acetyltransferase [Nitrososphaerales archaeon]|nr:homoserine O-acetyltransferase [Nitrososphaerales archaeon]
MIDQTHSILQNKTKYFTFARPPHEMVLESGDTLGPITLAYETYGELNSSKSNAILVLHALSGDAHAASLGEQKATPGWWDTIIGPGKAIDTDKYFVICSNVLGGCRGSTGPSSINPKTGRPYGSEFPIITVRDMVNAQRFLVDFLGIEKLMSVIGGSMGGMQVLQWMVSYPEKIRSAIPIATTMKHSPQQIALDEVGRQSIIADPNWRGGDYYGQEAPVKGLAVARMVGHITYMSDISMNEKFGRRTRRPTKDSKFEPVFEVEKYLEYRGDDFVKRFDANSYLYITKAMDYFDLLDLKNIDQVFKGVKTKVMVIAFKSDWLYPAYQSKEIVRACKLAGLETTYVEVNSTYGHDAFLLKVDEETHLITHFLNSVTNGNSKGTLVNETRAQNNR